MRVIKGLLLVALVLTATGSYAQERFHLSFFSVVPPHGWLTESDRQYELVSSGSGAEKPPFLFVSSCDAAANRKCPSNCELPVLAQSALVSDLKMSFSFVRHRGDYREYAASSTEKLNDGVVSTSARLLCGQGRLVYMALLEMKPARDADAEIDAVVNSIEWAEHRAP